MGKKYSVRQYSAIIGAAVLLGGAGLVLSQPGKPPVNDAAPDKVLKLSTVDRSSRAEVDYALLDRRLSALSREPAMVGLAVGVVENGRITFLKGYGETARGSGNPVTPQTVFRWASVSKGVAATMVAKLAEEGKINLDAPVANYAPDLKLPQGNEFKASVRDLLSHRVGLYRNAFDNKLEEGMGPSALRTQLVTLNQTCPPGTCWSYQNVAYDASSEMVERATALPYELALKRNLFDPLGMTHASASMAGLQSNKSWARPHNASRRELPMVDTYYKVPAAGGVNSDIKDMAVWMIAQMGEMPLVIDQAALDKLHAPLVKTPTERSRLRLVAERLTDAWYGLGWRAYDYAGHRMIGHRGGINGYRSLILFDPAKKSGVVALWNSNSSQPGGLEFEVMDMIYRLPFRDWLKLGSAANTAAAAEDEESGGQGNGDQGDPRQKPS